MHQLGTVCWSIKCWGLLCHGAVRVRVAESQLNYAVLDSSKARLTI